MRTCQCTLPYTNPNACRDCANNKETWPNETNHDQPFTWPTQPSPFYQPSKRVIEEFDKDGKIIRRTTEDIYPSYPSYPILTCTTGDSNVNVVK